MPVFPNSHAEQGGVATASRGLPALRLGLVNNMPDGALACTERQFMDVLDTTTPDIDIHLSFYSVPGIPRGEAGRAHLVERGYRPAADLRTEEIDALIVTGTEPKQSRLRDEPYWAELAELFDWIDEAGPSTIFSCLAAHAAVLHFDGIERERLAQKRFGLFEHAVRSNHALVENLPATVRVAHSRWNEVRRDALETSGYEILTEAPDAGIDLFVKQSRNLLLFFQGHPEYDSATLFREYRRDVQRFLAGAGGPYPQMPQNYFDDAEIAFLNDSRNRLPLANDETSLEGFPLVARAAIDIESGSAMTCVFRTWLQGIAAAKGELPVVAAPTPRFAGMRR